MEALVAGMIPMLIIVGFGLLVVGTIVVGIVILLCVGIGGGSLSSGEADAIDYLLFFDDDDERGRRGAKRRRGGGR